MSSLDILAAKSEVIDMLLRYCRAVDRLDAELLRSIFHDDAVIEHPPFTTDVDTFCAGLIALVGGLGPGLHQMTNILVEFDRGTAYTEAYFNAWHRLPKGLVARDDVFAAHDPAIDENVFMGGRYVNWLDKRDGAWRISRHLTIVEWEHWEAADERSPLTRTGLAKRDRSDPAYQRR